MNYLTLHYQRVTLQLVSDKIELLTHLHAEADLNGSPKFVLLTYMT